MYIPFFNTKKIIICGWLLASACCLCAQLPGDSITLNFRVGRALVDSGYMENRRALHHMEELFADTAFTSRIDSIRIHSYASPDGRLTFNKQLAHRRSAALKGYLVWKYPHLDQYRIRIHSQASGWERLLPAIENDADVPCRKQVTEILISDIPDIEKQIRLQHLAGGKAYRYLAARYLPAWRNASVCTIWMKDENKKPTITAIKEMQGVANPTSLVETELSYLMQDHPYTYKVKRPLLAVKTNLLFDVAMMPNVEVEVPIRNRWSLNGEVMFPWWLFENDKYCLQILMGSVEGRYWLGNRKKKDVLTGHFLGLYAGGGKYDLQWDRDGYQGEFFIAAGLSYGYAMKIARNLRLEFNLGIGLLRTNYEYYHPLDNYQTLLWQHNGRYTWFGPTKAKVSFVWLLHHKVKVKKGGIK